MKKPKIMKNILNYTYNKRYKKKSLKKFLLETNK